MKHDFMKTEAKVHEIPGVVARGLNNNIKGLNVEFRDTIKDWNSKFDAVRVVSYVLRLIEEMGHNIYAYDINCVEPSFRCRNSQGEDIKVGFTFGDWMDTSPEISITKNNITSNYECRIDECISNNKVKLALIIESVIYEKDEVKISRHYNTYNFSYGIKNKNKKFSLCITPIKYSNNRVFCLPNEASFLKDLCKIKSSTSAIEIYNMIIERYEELPIKEVEISTPSGECLIINRKKDKLVEYSKSVTLASGKEVIGKYEVKDDEEKILVIIKKDNIDASIIDEDIDKFIKDDFEGTVKSLKK